MDKQLNDILKIRLTPAKVGWDLVFALDALQDKVLEHLTEEPDKQPVSGSSLVMYKGFMGYVKENRNGIQCVYDIESHSILCSVGNKGIHYLGKTLAEAIQL